MKLVLRVEVAIGLLIVASLASSLALLPSAHGSASIPQVTPSGITGMPIMNPRIKQIVDSISEERIASTLKRLESFYTRHTLSDTTNSSRGIGAARQWIFEELKSYGPRLQVSFDSHFVKKQLPRLVRDFELRNVMAVLPGTTDPSRQLIVSGHYDSLARPAGGRAIDWTQTEIFAPGVTDDGSGTAAVMELARVLSQFEFEKTIIFIAFAGEEEGLVGSTLYAQQAAHNHQLIEGVLNNDIIGGEVAGNGAIDNRRVYLFSEDPNDSSSRQLARYIKRAGERYYPSMRIDLVFRQDRIGRGGDHIPFNEVGYSAVRFNTPNENFSHQHTVTDTLENASPKYTAQVARINAVAVASLAWAPRAPVVLDERHAPMLGRGTSGYSARLRWHSEAPEADLAGYAVVIRSTTASDWEREIFVGTVNEWVLEDSSIDTSCFGVKAIDREGNESLVSAYVFTRRARGNFETFTPEGRSN